MNNTPAEIFRECLVGLGFGTMPTAQQAWPVYLGFMADTPDNALGVYDTAGRLQGRTVDGTLTKYGIQVRARGEYLTTYKKLNAIYEALDEVKDDTVILGSNVYVIHVITKTSPVVALGREESKPRHNFTFNVVINLNQVP